MVSDFCYIKTTKTKICWTISYLYIHHKFQFKSFTKDDTTRQCPDVSEKTLLCGILRIHSLRFIIRFISLFRRGSILHLTSKMSFFSVILPYVFTTRRQEFPLKCTSTFRSENRIVLRRFLLYYVKKFTELCFLYLVKMNRGLLLTSSRESFI